MWSPPPSADDITRYKRSALGKNHTGFSAEEIEILKGEE
jgi:hypothetical protein